MRCEGKLQKRSGHPGHHGCDWPFQCFALKKKIKHQKPLSLWYFLPHFANEGSKAPRGAGPCTLGSTCTQLVESWTPRSPPAAHLFHPPPRFPHHHPVPGSPIYAGLTLAALGDHSQYMHWTRRSQKADVLPVNGFSWMSIISFSVGALLFSPLVSRLSLTLIFRGKESIQAQGLIQVHPKSAFRAPTSP